MAPKPRDLLKTRSQRVGEVLSNVHLKAGQANSQVVLWGVDIAPGTTTTKVNVTAGEVVLAHGVVAITAKTDQTLPAGVSTGAGEYRKVLVEVDATGTVSFQVGNKVSTAQADAQLPKGDPNCISVGYLEIPPSFAQGTTPVTGGMCKDVLYHQ